MCRDEERIRVYLTPASFAKNAWRMDGPKNEPGDSAASGDATPETSPPSGREPLASDFPVPRTGEGGKPIYDQEFFLALARCGREVWNQWCRSNPTVWITFEAIDFREPKNATIDFSGFKFGNYVSFSRCTFGVAEFTDATFGDSAFFQSACFYGAKFRRAKFGFASFLFAKFSGGANFEGAIFAAKSLFMDADFSDDINFREARFDIKVDFSRARFGDCANLSYTSFGAEAKFDDVYFSEYVNLTHATFSNNTQFRGANFGLFPNLSGTAFGDRCNLSGTRFGKEADLSGVNFGHFANLSCAIFDDVEFNYSKFGYCANLSGATMDSARFIGAIFESRANFRGLTAKKGVDFRGAMFLGLTDFRAMSQEEWQLHLSTLTSDIPADPREDFKARMAARMATLTEDGTGPTVFREASFQRAKFRGEALFSGRRFEGRCDFTDVQFKQPPEFDACEGKHKLDLSGAKIQFAGRLVLGHSRWARAITRAWNNFVDEQEAMARVAARDEWQVFELILMEQLAFPVEKGTPQWGPHNLVLEATAICTPGWTIDSLITLRLRQLRELAAETNNHDLERDLYIEERKAERGIKFARSWREGWKKRLSPRMFAHLFWMAVMFGYWLLADYGRSVVRPLVGLAISVFVFHWAYGSVLIAPSDPGRLEDFRRAGWAFAISSAVPFVGALTLERDVKLTLLCGDRPIDATTAQRQNALQCLPVPGRRFQLLVILQSIFSAMCVFFIALAMRNYFKLN
jgi:uncharacterized protein YjbI with pentapeptide repeats